ncbi:MAG: hypothetical protein KR126chlam4_00606 [Candidatus Anoxychlamydiales bacterium]|nr:hypothetical protein [Candidatus Anoxychlamydiales bacterium]NGX40775.1 hypothetical protein [Candidatus Anoxychlamydiales bacterium]HEU64360.1 DUF3604 domain-containing protein [Chlamydiota bacterium]
MRRSICQADPHYAIAGEKRTWRFSYTPSNALSKNTKLIFEMQSDKRPIDWQLPNVDIKKKSNVIWLEIPNGKNLVAKQIKDPKTTKIGYEFILPRDIKIGESLIICMGSIDGKDNLANMCQYFTQRKKIFNLHINVKSKTETETFHMDVRGTKLKTLKIITPSFVARNKRFDVVVRFEDEYGNLTNNTDEETLIELSYEHLRENLNWKLFIPETGFITLPNLYFNEPGIYKIKLKNLKTNELFYSPPIKCFDFSNLCLFWGTFHSESEKYDATKNIENCLRYFRDDKALQFYATSCFDSEEETPSAAWKTIVSQIAEFNEDERFTAFLGLQWLGTLKEEGLRELIFTKDNKNILRKKDLRSNSLKKIYKTLSSKDLLAIPSFTMGSESVYDFKDFNEEFEKVVEIYNAWGSSEMSSKEGNLRPISGPVKENPEGSIQKALLSGCRFGFVAGGLDDRGIYSKFFDSNQKQYSQGLSAIIAKDQTRDSLIEALQKKSCYATTGKKIIAGLSVANEPMGSEISTSTKPGLLYNRYISGYVIGTTKLKEVILLRNNKILTRFTPDDFQFNFIYDDTESLKDICIKAKEDKPPFIFYYLRAIQEDSHIVWTSPIWVDLEEPAIVIKKVKKK